MCRTRTCARHVPDTCRTWFDCSETSQLGWLTGHGQTESRHVSDRMTQLSGRERWRESDPTRYLYTLNPQIPIPNRSLSLRSQIDLVVDLVVVDRCFRSGGSTFSWSICSLGRLWIVVVWLWIVDISWWYIYDILVMVDWYCRVLWCFSTEREEKKTAKRKEGKSAWVKSWWYL